MHLTETLNSLKKNGLTQTIKKIANYLLSRRRFTKTVLSLHNAEERFTWIYKNNYWGHESASGSGSTILYTEKIRQELPKLISEFNIKSILDAPCGDFNWMQTLLPKLDIDYIGADIVKTLIESHKENYESKTTKFIVLNLIEDQFPTADLMFCRDCLFHLSYHDIQKVLANFVNSNIPYLLTTTHKNFSSFKNKDIVTGDFRLIDLFSHPFLFPTIPLARIDDWAMPDIEREMCLFSREQIKVAIDRYLKSDKE